MKGRSRKRREISLPLVSLLCAAALAWGWWVREERYLTAERGLGYALGIAGLSCMTLLLFYSARKRASFMRSWGPLRRWFGIHMVLGILGPAFILFHSNFRLGSLNSNVALACVLLVAASGVVGRIIYPKIHHGLSSQRSSLREIRRETETQRASLRSATDTWPELEKRLAEVEAWALAPVSGMTGALARRFSVGGRVRAARRDCMTFTKGRATAAVEDYLAQIRRVVGYHVYASLFALWHAVHLPLCVILFAAAAIHVVAVHLY